MSNYSYNYDKQPIMAERIISALSYLTYGVVGLVWLIIAAVGKKTIKPFLKFNIIQSIFIALVFAVLSMSVNIIMNILSIVRVIPFIGGFINSFFDFILFYLVQYQILMGFSLLGLLVLGLNIYLIVCSLSGTYSQVPYISNIVRKMV